MMRRLSYVPLVWGLVACEPPYRDALRAGDLQASTNPSGAVSFYEKAVSLGAVAQGHLKLAELAERQHAWEDAAQHYVEAQKALPKEPSLAHAQARVLLESGKREQALEALKAATANFPEDRFSALMFGALATAPHDVALAEAALKAHPSGGIEGELVSQALAARRDPAHLVVKPAQGTPLLPVEQLFQLAAVLEGNGRPGLSAVLLGAGTQRYPTEYRLWYPLLRIQVALRDYHAAQTTAEKLPSDIRFTPEALMLQAQIHTATGDRPAAISAVQRAIRALPEDATDKRFSAQLLLGQALLDAGRGKDSAEAFTLALQLVPNQIKALLGKASAELTLGEFDTARESTTKALEAAPLDPNARKLHVVSLLGSEQFDAAKANADDYVAKAPERADAWALRAKAQLEHSKVLPPLAAQRQAALHGARDDVRKALELNSNEPAALLRFWLAVEEAVVGYPENVKRVRTWLVEQRRWTGLLQVASYCNERNDTTTATEIFRDATLVAPDEPQAWRVYAVQLETTGALASALEAQARLLTLKQADEGAFRDVARLSRKLGKTDQAVATYRQWLNQNPNAVLALNNLAAILGSSPDTLNEAVQLAQKARELARSSPAVADTLGWLLYSRNQGEDRAQALTLLTEASSGMDNPLHHLHLAEALAAAGKAADAKTAIERALEHGNFDERPRALELSKQLGG